MGVTKLEDELNGEDNKKIKDKANDPLSMLKVPMTRSRSKKLQEALIGYMQDWASQGSSIDHTRSSPSEDTTEWALFNILQVQIHED